MPHYTGRCYCGREIHLPAGASPGYRWRCYQCGSVWTLRAGGWAGQQQAVLKRSRRAAPKPRVVIIQVPSSQPQLLPTQQPNPFVPPNLALPAPPPYPQQRKGLIGWLFGG